MRWRINHDEMGGYRRGRSDYQADATEAEAHALLSTVKLLEEELRDLRLVSAIARDMVRLLPNPSKQQLGDHYASALGSVCGATISWRYGLFCFSFGADGAHIPH